MAELETAEPNGQPDIPVHEQLAAEQPAVDDDEQLPIEPGLQNRPWIDEDYVPPDPEPPAPETAPREAGEEAAAEPADLVERLRALKPEGVSEKDFEDLLADRKAAADFREYFQSAEEADEARDAREDFRELSMAVSSGDLSRVWDAVKHPRSAEKAVQSFKTQFAEAHPQAYGELVKEIRVESARMLEEALLKDPDPEMQQVAGFLAELYSRNVLGVRSYKELVEPPELRQRREEMEAEHARRSEEIIQRDWGMIWRNLGMQVNQDYSNALRKAGIEPTEAKLKHASGFALTRLNADRRFNARLSRLHSGARRLGHYTPEIAAEITDLYARRFGKEAAAAIENVRAEYQLGPAAQPQQPKPKAPNRVPAAPVRSRAAAGPLPGGSHVLDTVDFDKLAPGQDLNAIATGRAKPIYTQ